MDYGDIIYEKHNSDSFKRKIEYIKYKAGIAVAGAIQGTSRECLYQELCLESLENRR